MTLALEYMLSRKAVGKKPGANSLVGNCVDESSSTELTGGDVGAVESMEEAVLSSSESETTKEDDCSFKCKNIVKACLQGSKTNETLNKQLHSSGDMQSLRRGHSRVLKRRKR